MAQSLKLFHSVPTQAQRLLGFCRRLGKGGVLRTDFPDRFKAGRAVPSAPRWFKKLWKLRAFPAATGSLWTASPAFGLHLLLGVLLLWTASTWAQVRNPATTPGPLPPAEGEQLARSLIANLLSQKPNQNSSNAAVVRIRGADRKTREIPARFELIVTPTNYWNVYQAAVPGTDRAMKLTIMHAEDQPNRYLLSEPAAPGGTNRPPRVLSGSELSLPFAGSDFWVQDLGLEFLHWPQQQVLKKEMRKGQFCAVLESRNPRPVRGDYLRVVSWIGINHPDAIVLVHADGYDDRNQELKAFDPKNLAKVNGVYQLESMEMRNVQTGSRTLIAFDLGNQ